MSDKNDKAREILDKSDYEYEKKIYEDEKRRQQELEAKKQAAIAARKKREKEAIKERERQLARERIELMKKKNTEDSTLQESGQEEDAQEAQETAVKLSPKKKIQNFIYLNKWWLILAGFVVFIAAFIIYHQLQIKKADLTVMMIANNGLTTKEKELEELFEEYVDDIDGNGYVHVNVIVMPLDPTSNSQDQKDTRSKFLANLYSTESMLVITDTNTEYQYLEIMDHKLSEKFPGNKYVDEIGFSLNMQLVADKIGYKDMPNDVHISIRQPVATVEDSLETAKKNYDTAYKYLEKMIKDLTQKAKDSDDPGLSTPPKKLDLPQVSTDSSSQ
ncbi:hypothetical protein [Ruminococcus sp. FC2018]|uniref:hypothetical protein n=1 Tax=Ruminococcus sp. FC2018 TaxID=1410617 RepID=UPI000490D850|nr:hypothetical protein [Ruminococcus sp. FC2018]